jgi:hypothetical protein
MAEEVAAFRVRSPGLRGHDLRSASTSFARGMAGRLAERLEAMHHVREKTLQAGRPAGTALMVVKARVVGQAFRAAKVRLVSPRGTVIPEDGAYRQGYAAGARANLDRPLTGGQGLLLEP